MPLCKAEVTNKVITIKSIPVEVTANLGLGSGLEFIVVAGGGANGA